jgi:hypothetical protein
VLEVTGEQPNGAVRAQADHRTGDALASGCAL